MLMRNRKLAILGFHRVLEQKDDIETYPDKVEFEGVLRMLKRCFNVLPLVEGVNGLRSGKLPSRALVLTFDDGYLDNFTVALPLLQKFDLPATCFVATGFLHGDCMWNDKIIHAVKSCPDPELDLTSLQFPTFELSDSKQRGFAIGELLKRLKYLPYDERAEAVDKVVQMSNAAPVDRLMMNADEVRLLHRAGVEIGAHTVTHPILSRLSPERGQVEIADSKRELEAVIGHRVASFAYPNGRPNQDYDEGHVKSVMSEGFDLAVSTHWGCARRDSDHFQLPRMAIYGKSLVKSALRLYRSYFQ